MELTKLFASGRISELAGEKARNLDIRMRTLGFYRNAKKHAALLNDETRTFFQKYIDGVNAFIETRPKSIHLEFKLAGIKPAPWTIADSLTILYYMGWGSAANFKGNPGRSLPSGGVDCGQKFGINTGRGSGQMAVGPGACA